MEPGLRADDSNPGAVGLTRDDDMAGYDPGTGRWRALPAPSGYPLLAAPPIWAGTQLLEVTNSGQLLAFHR